MKAAVVETPGKLVVRDVAEPIVGEYDCLCETLYGATCSGTDSHLIHGDPMPFDVFYPLMLGHESIGRVLRVGAGVENFEPGDLVTRVINRNMGGVYSFWGGFAERTIIEDHQAIRKHNGRNIDIGAGIHQVLPAQTDPAAATIVITWRETLSFINRIGVAEGDAVLIVGSGGNGLSFANHAKNLGAKDVAMVGSIRRKAAASAVGCDAFFSYRREDLSAAVREVGPFDLIIDAVGKTGQLDRVLPTLKAGGKIAMYGIDDFGKVTVLPTLAPGSFTWSSPGYDEGEAHAAVIDFMQAGKLRAEEYLDLENVFLLDEIGQAFDAVSCRDVIKAVVRLA